MFALLERRGALRTSSLLFVVPGITAVASWPILNAPVGALAAAGLVVAGLGLSLALRGPDHASRPLPAREGQADDLLVR
jgi:hypothetical protein